MEIILTKQCESLTGALGNGYGYFIQRRRGQDGKYHFFSQRSKHLPIPRDGHLRFIFACADSKPPCRKMCFLPRLSV